MNKCICDRVLGNIVEKTISMGTCIAVFSQNRQKRVHVFAADIMKVLTYFDGNTCVQKIIHV